VRRCGPARDAHAQSSACVRGASSGPPRPSPRTHPAAVEYNVYIRSSKRKIVNDTVPLTARVAATVAARLRALADVEDRSVSYLVAEAVERYLADEEWQIGEVQAAVTEADAPDTAFTPQEDVETWAKQLASTTGTPRPTRKSRGNRAPAA
jgi:RHH-type transcriptional regulator, rel operon repressor / antitoxin RelB